MQLTREMNHVKDYDVIVAGGGVAGVAAAVTAKRMGKSVLLIEKTVGLGGLATTGLISLFVSMCNGRGRLIAKGLCAEMVELATKYSFDTVPPEWKNGEPGPGCTVRYKTRFSSPMFLLTLTDFCDREGVELLFDTVITQPVMEGGVCKGLAVENKTGCEFYGAKMVVDTTGDADVLYRAGVPTVEGKNLHVFTVDTVTMENVQKVWESQDMRWLCTDTFGGRAGFFGTSQPDDVPLRAGPNVRDVTEYIIRNHRDCLERLKADDRLKRNVVCVPEMCQFRTTRRIDGDYTMQESDACRHFEDSVCLINDNGKRDLLYEIPLRCLTRTGFPNLITAGRCAAGEGRMWDVMRVIPPAILTGQAAGAAVCQAIDEGCAITDIHVPAVQQALEKQNVFIHFRDEWVSQEGK